MNHKPWSVVVLYSSNILHLLIMFLPSFTLCWNTMSGQHSEQFFLSLCNSAEYKWDFHIEEPKTTSWKFSANTLHSLSHTHRSMFFDGQACSQQTLQHSLILEWLSWWELGNCSQLCLSPHLLSAQSSCQQWSEEAELRPFSMGRDVGRVCPQQL